MRVHQVLARDSQSLSTVSGFNRVAEAAEQLRAAVHEVEEGLAAQKAAFQRLQASCKVRYHVMQKIISMHPML